MSKKKKRKSGKGSRGRPPIWTDPIDLKKLVFDYFHKKDVKPTLAGLALALKIDRQTLYNYGKKDEFFDIIKNARDRVAEVYEERLVYGSQPTGVIFALKNMGWADRRDYQHEVKDMRANVTGFDLKNPSEKEKPKKKRKYTKRKKPSKNDKASKPNKKTV